MDDAELLPLAHLLRDSKYTVVITGAGVSTESGLPDFRSPNSGLWRDGSAMEVLSRSTLENDPERFYARGLALLDVLTAAEPNDTHHVLADWEKRGLVKMLITQNIDNLHYQAGSRRLLEVHGQLRTIACDCGISRDFSELVRRVRQREVPPRCQCGRNIRPDVVLFGDAMPDSFASAVAEVEQSELLLVVGSSLQVAPVAYLPNLAKQLAIINLSPTPVDAHAEVVIRGRSGEILPRLDRLMRG